MLSRWLAASPTIMLRRERWARIDALVSSADFSMHYIAFHFIRLITADDDLVARPRPMSEPRFFKAAGLPMIYRLKAFSTRIDVARGR